MTSISKVYNWLQEGGEITGDMIADVIHETRTRAEEQKKLYERYKGSSKGVPILNRTFPIENLSKINNKLANDFFSDIVHTKIGYFAGKPITYKYPDIKDIDKELLGGFLKRNAYADLDSETAKMAAIAGNAARYLYINLEGEASVINVPPWECIFICDEIGVSDAPYAIRYYTVDRDNKKVTKVEFFDDEKVTYWVRDGEESAQGAFILDSTEEANPLAHLMNGCPLICFPNNEEMQGDCEKVLTLIDSYDKTASDMNSEIEQFRLAYMAFYGAAPDSETLDLARQTGAFGFPEKDSRMEFVTKNINSQAVENHLTMLERNILYFAQSVRFSDESFGTASGIAMKFRTFNLESKCIVAQNKFTKALYRMFSVLSGYFDKKGITYDPWEMEFSFVRNFPLNTLEEMQTISTGKGLISDETLYSQISFIKDPKEEVQKLKDEQDEYMKAQAEIDAELAKQDPVPEEVVVEEAPTGIPQEQPINTQKST